MEFGVDTVIFLIALSCGIQLAMGNPNLNPSVILQRRNDSKSGSRPCLLFSWDGGSDATNDIVESDQSSNLKKESLLCKHLSEEIKVCRVVQVRWAFALRIENCEAPTTDLGETSTSITAPNLPCEGSGCSGNYVIFAFYGVPQESLEFAFKHYGRLRDFSNVNKAYLYSPMFILGKIIADAANFTLLAKPEAIKRNITMENYPQMIPALQTFESSGLNVFLIWAQYGNSPWGDVRMTRLPSLGYNFAYCDVPKVNLLKPWNLSSLSKAFHINVWIVLFLAMLTLSLAIYAGARSRQVWSAADAFSVFQSVFSVVVSVGPPPLVGVDKSMLLVIWMFACIVIVNYYTGTITSEMISPPKEEAMTYIGEALQKNYSLLFDNLAHMRIVNATVQNFTIYGPTADGTTEEIWSIDTKSLKHLLDKMDNSSLILNKTIFTREFALNRKVITLYLWPFVFAIVNQANIEIHEEKRRRPTSFKMRHCYVGKRIIPSGEVFYTFTPPRSTELWKVAELMMESGLYNRWMHEFIALIHSNRVQDRYMVASPTDLRHSESAEASPLQMDGKVARVLFLWNVCLVASLVSFLVELCLRFMTKKRKMLFLKRNVINVIVRSE